MNPKTLIAKAFPPNEIPRRQADMGHEEIEKLKTQRSAYGVMVYAALIGY